MIFTLRNEVLSPSWNGMLTLHRYEVLNATGISTMKEAEAFYRLDEYLDLFESELEPLVESENGNVGTLRWSGTQQFPGFELSFEDQTIHLAGFARG